MVADLRPRIAADIAVGNDHAFQLVVETRRRGNVADLLAQRAGLDVHFLFHVGHAVDDIRVRAGDVDQDRCVDLLPALQGDAAHPALAFSDFDHFGIEPELPAFGLGGALRVVAGEARVADVSRFGNIDRAGDIPAGRLAELGVIQ